ncbi:Apc15p protein-domain-containing protein [Triangularia setosa]|uniref:Apc15p protein-domain-containing protein n=1 Tax=Triangularia setosa TaxID=2587417 RepID=A0AAN6WH10_9PEZI|nr:Apc15p protein-domain-containing protein [Podospora setosa]
MFSTLPDLTPRDSHSLWYTSPRHPPLPQSHHPSSAFTDPSTSLDSPQPPPPPPPQQQQPQNPRHKHNSSGGPNSVIDRSLLGRLRADEDIIRRRQSHIANLGQSWLKPPGVSKTLFQIREEKREAEEHAEAVRREMAAQELAEAAERAQQEQEQEQDEDLLPGEEEEEGMMVDLDGDIPEGSEMEMEGDMDDDIPEGDLDDDIPEGDLDDNVPEGDLDDDIPSGGGFGYDGASDDVDEDDDEEDTEEQQNATFQTAQFDTSGDESSSSIDPNDLSLTEVQQQRRIERRELQSRMATMRAQEQRMRELMARNQHSQPHNNDDDLYGGHEDNDHHHGGPGHDMLEEEDLVSSTTHHQEGAESGGEDDDMDMEADLDDEIPDASGLSGVSGGGAGFGMDGAGYEHTDSEAELSDDDGGTQGGNVSFAVGRGSVRGSVRRQQQQGFRSSGVGQQQQNFRSSGGGHFRSSGMGRGGGNGGARFDPRSSLNHDISGFLSLDGSSMIGSSPNASFRRSRQG